MRKRVYISTLFAWWTVERQTAALGDEMIGATVFRDVLPRRARQGHQAALLPERDKMLRSTSRRLAGGEIVYVASLAVLARNESDLRAVLAAIDGRGALLHSMECGDAGEPDQTVERWKAARERSRLEGASKRGGEVTKSKLEPIYQAKADRIRGRWGDANWNTTTLLEEAAISRNTAVKYLGLRAAALARHRARIQRAAAAEMSDRKPPK